MKIRCLLQNQRAISIPWDGSCRRFLVFIDVLWFATEIAWVMTGRPPHADDHQVTVLILRSRKPERPLSLHTFGIPPRNAGVVQDIALLLSKF
jgi:hypothetical protein